MLNYQRVIFFRRVQTTNQIVLVFGRESKVSSVWAGKLHPGHQDIGHFLTHIPMIAGGLTYVLVFNHTWDD